MLSISIRLIQLAATNIFLSVPRLYVINANNTYLFFFFFFFFFCFFCFVILIRKLILNISLVIVSNNEFYCVRIVY